MALFVIAGQQSTFADSKSDAGRVRIWQLSYGADYIDALKKPASDPVIEAHEFRLELLSYRRLQQAPPIDPIRRQPDTLTTPMSPLALGTASVFRPNARVSRLRPVSRRRVRPRSVADTILGIEARPRSASDTGSLLGLSSRSRGVTTQKRNPIISDPRVRGSRVGQLAASGSHWLPARIDLDTLLSKIDSRLVEDVQVIKGPYSVRNGPGHSFIDVQLVDSPRSNNGPQLSGSTSIDYQSNGERWYGRQTGEYASNDFGLRVGYGHRTATDYESGRGQRVPSSYQSRDFDLAAGWDLGDGKSIEAVYLHQNQRDVELPGQAFDLDTLLTNAVELTWVHEQPTWADRFEMEAWLNESRLEGGAQNPAKRRTFPLLDTISYVGLTDVESISTGARAEAIWDLGDSSELMAGVDVRVIRQELDEISNGRIGINQFTNVNSPIPQSMQVNPGLFAEIENHSIDDVVLISGVRVDLVTAEVTDDASRLQMLGTGVGQNSLAQILGSGEFDQSFGLWSAFVSAEYSPIAAWRFHATAGHGQRAPSLTELYAAEPFMFLLQNGLNTVTGAPQLNAERRWQIDVGASFESDRFRANATGFHAWVHDQITFEALSVLNGPPNNQVDQINLKYVNTQRATLTGFEASAELDLTTSLSAFGTASYVEGQDHTRNGQFATMESGTGTASQQVRGMRRGAFSGLPTPSSEPLPQLPPLQSRLGLRLNGKRDDIKWQLEVSARVIDNQSRIARSLAESTTPGFTVWDIRSYWELSENITVVAGVENFTDKDYREHFDFRSFNPVATTVRQPGASFYFGSLITY